MYAPPRSLSCPVLVLCPWSVNYRLIMNYYISDDNKMLVVSDVFLPSSTSYIYGIGELNYPNTKTLKLKDRPHAYAAALWILSYVSETVINYYSDISERSYINDYDPIYLTDNDGGTLSDTPVGFYEKAKKCLKDANIISTSSKSEPRYDEGGNVSFSNLKGTKYDLDRSQYKYEFVHHDRLEIPIPDYKLIKRKETKRKRVKKKVGSVSKKSTKKNKKQTERHFEQLLPDIEIPVKKGRRAKHTLFTESKEVRLSSDKLFDDLNACSYGTSNITDKSSQKGMRLVFGLIDLMRRHMTEAAWEMFADWDGIPTHVEVPTHYCKLSQKYIREQLATRDEKPSPKAIVKAKNILIDQLRWVEVLPSGKGGQSYLVGGKPIQYRFTEKFYDGTADAHKSNKSYKLTTTYATEYKALSVCSIDPSVYDIFDEVAKKREWDDNTKKIQREKLDNFHYNRGYFNQPRPASRVYTEIGMLPREFRKYVLIDGEETEEIDIKSAHPLFIAYFMEESKVRNDWIKTVSEGDIYLDIIDQFSLSPDLRDPFKKLFNAFLNGGGREAYDGILELKVDFGKHMKKHYPFLHETVKRLGGKYSEKYKNNGAALVLQELESHIMGTHFMCHSKFECISIHDGLLCRKTDAGKLIKACEERGREVLNFDICVERK